MFEEAIFYFRCVVYFLLSDKRPSIRDVYRTSNFDTFMPRLNEPHPVTPKQLLETYDRIHSRRGDAMPLAQGCKKAHSSNNGRFRYEVTRQNVTRNGIIRGRNTYLSLFARSREFNPICSTNSILQHSIAGFYAQFETLVRGDIFKLSTNSKNRGAKR